MHRLPWRVINVKLGEELEIGWSLNRMVRVRVIKVTPKGYNFLIIDTHKCALKKHMYQGKFVAKEGLDLKCSSRLIIKRIVK